jgi:beta-lysine N6-acetyltransferase
VNKKIRTEDAYVSVYSDPFNSRIRIDDYSGLLTSVLEIIENETEGWVEKLIIKSRTQDLLFFESKGFINEAHVDNYFPDTDMYFMTKYFSAGRQKSLTWDAEELIVKTILKEQVNGYEADITNVCVASKDDCKDLADLYRDVFPLYPTSLNDPLYLEKTMDEGTRYVFIREEGKIISAASAEINAAYKNAELTDCASHGEAQGKGHMKKLLSKLEELLLHQGIHCLYTIARAESVGMNKAFHQLGYQYGGRLKKNLIIYSGLEDMNVWYKNV